MSTQLDPDRLIEQFTADEMDLWIRWDEGETVVINMGKKSHSRLWAWAHSVGLGVRIDRKSIWGNPFILDEDGDRAQVVNAYSDFYLPHKPQLLDQVAMLQGKALGCWCSPEPCHGDVLAALARVMS